MSTKNNEKPDDDCGVLSHSLEVVPVVPANICRLAKKCVSPSDLVQPGLVVPASEENKADGAEEVGVGDLDHQHEDVHVDELGGTKVGHLGVSHLANKTSHIAHVGEVRSDNFFVDILTIRSRGVSDSGADADEERHSLGVEAVLQKPCASTTSEMYFKNVVYHQVD